MKNAATDADLALLSAIRGTFTESKTGKFTNLFFAYLFLVGIPGVFVVALLSNGWPHPPLGSDQWAGVVIAPVSVVLGFCIREFTGYSYVFDGTKIRQVNRTGRVWKEIEIQKVIMVTVDRSSRAPSMSLRTERVSMGILLTPDLLKEVQRASNQSTQNNAGKGPLQDAGPGARRV